MSYLSKGFEVLEKIHNNGYEAYFVGGFVRDYLLNHPYNDIDIATNALPKELKCIFEIVDSGIKFNSVKIKYEGYEFETTTYREDLAYNDHRHPIFQKAERIVDDLKRRDFTINAMAMNEKKQIIDLYQGQQDLKNQLIRTVDDAEKRFNEDALRMLRAAYFAAKLNFNIETKTLQAMRKCGYLIQALSNDRIFWELEKIINTQNIVKGFQVLIDTGIINFMPLYKEAILAIVDFKLEDINCEKFLTLAYYNHLDLFEQSQIKNVYKNYIRKVYEVVKEKKISAITLFKNGLDIVLTADLINVIYQRKKTDKTQILALNNKMAIHSISDLKIKAIDIIKLLDLKDMKLVNNIIEEIVILILNNKLNNDVNDINKYLLKKYHYAK